MSFDEDADELLDKGEATTLFSWIFGAKKKFDSDGDNQISMKEFHKVGGVQPGASEKAKKDAKKMGRGIFKQLDVNGDKQLSPQEYFFYENGCLAGQLALRNLFTMADLDGDKILSVDELIAVRKKQELGGILKNVVIHF